MITPTDQKDCRVFCWLPTLYTVSHPNGLDIGFCWGFYIVTLWDTEARRAIKKIKQI